MCFEDQKANLLITNILLMGGKQQMPMPLLNPRILISTTDRIMSQTTSPQLDVCPVSRW